MSKICVMTTLALSWRFHGVFQSDSDKDLSEGDTSDDFTSVLVNHGTVVALSESAPERR